MASRPIVTVQAAEEGGAAKGTCKMPAIMLAPIRPDVVLSVHSGVAKNKRQAYAVSMMAGYGTSAESWGTGRAVSRIPRVHGSGTHRSGQAAFGNMCRGGRMFSPTRTYRKWHVAVAKNQRRYALASALSASALPSLLMARGHRVDGIPEVPLVVDDAAESIQKTADAVALLKALGAYEDVEKVKDSKKVRRGKGKMRNRRYTSRLGPLVVYAKNDGIVQAFRNIPGVELADVSRLNLLELAPGGHLGRFCIWTESAFKALDTIYGVPGEKASTMKRSGGTPYVLPRQQMTNSDLARIINSDEIQSVVSAPKQNPTALRQRKRNPLKRFQEMVKLNPHAVVEKRAAIIAHKRAKAVTQSRGSKAKRTVANQYYGNMTQEGVDEVDEDEDA